MIAELRAYVARREVWIFLCLIVVVNAVFVTGVARDILPRGLYPMGRFLLLAGVLGAVVLVGSGWAGIGQLLRPMLRWRVHPGWYLLALTWAALLCVLVLVTARAVNPAESPALEAQFGTISRPRVLLTVLVGAFVGEIVWVSYAVRKLSSRFTVFVGSQIVGVFWTLWWMPMVILNYGIIPDLPPVALLINQMGVAAMCGFMYKHTGSGLVVLLLQTMVNSVLLIFPVVPTTGGVPIYWGYAITYYVAVALLYYGFGPWPLLFASRRRTGISPTS